MNGGQDYPLTIQLLLLILSTVFFLAVSPFLGFLGVACAFDGFVGHVSVNCTTILTNNAMMEEP